MRILSRLFDLLSPNRTPPHSAAPSSIQGLESMGFSVRCKPSGIHISPRRGKTGPRVYGRAANTLWTAVNCLGGEYDFTPSKAGEKFIVIDIGLNIGCASLYFAAKDFIEHIYAFEPFIPTLELARHNMRLNPALAKKITIYDFGLSDKSDCLEMSYRHDFPGSMSSVCDKFHGSGQIEQIAVKQSRTILSPIFEKHPGHSIMMKIDCEGAEGEILADLAAAGLLERVSIIILEWHNNTFVPLIELLAKHGFQTEIYGEQPAHGTGMLRATR